jgi:hypothetical protein
MLSLSVVSRGIDTTVHVSKRAHFGGNSQISATATDSYVRQPKPIRKQPENLRPRFTPIGVPTVKTAQPSRSNQFLKADPGLDSDESEEEDEDEDVTMSNTAAHAPSLPNGKLKRKQPTENDGDESDDEGEEREPTLSPVKSPVKVTKRPKVSPVPLPPNFSQVKTTTSIAPQAASSPAMPTKKDTPGKTSKSKKSASQPVSTSSAKKETPIPPPSYGQGS